MSYRAAVVLIENGKIALVERHRQELHYFTFPGGHIERGESPEEAALREVEEELGLKVALKRLVARIGWHGKWQYYYLAETLSGAFGSGLGEEIRHPHPEKGSYLPMWMPTADLLEQPVLPREMAELVVRFLKEGWPEAPVVIPE